MAEVAGAVEAGAMLAGAAAAGVVDEAVAGAGAGAAAGAAVAFAGAGAGLAGVETGVSTFAGADLTVWAEAGADAGFAIAATAGFATAEPAAVAPMDFLALPSVPSFFRYVTMMYPGGATGVAEGVGFAVIVAIAVCSLLLRLSREW